MVAAGLLRSAREPGGAPGPQRVALGAGGLAAPGPSRAALPLAAVPAAIVALAPALGGHAGVVIDSVALLPGGDWRIHVTSRVSEFDQYEASLKVPVR